jgi:DHA1 family multidrug resistance protein-like MFS transporter
MEDVIRDSMLGQLVRALAGNKLFPYPEDDPNFKIPWESDSLSKEKTIEATLDATPETSALHQNNLEAALTTIPTARSSLRNEFRATVTKTRSRETTRPFSRERFEVEREEATERQESNIIIPQKTADGIILVDWYTTEDPANPQNWNSWKKAWVTFIIWLYTFIVYMASSIYTSAEPQVMHKFGIGPSKAALVLSVYVLGYGTGPMVRQAVLCSVCLLLNHLHPDLLSSV